MLRNYDRARQIHTLSQNRSDPGSTRARDDPAKAQSRRWTIQPCLALVGRTRTTSRLAVDSSRAVVTALRKRCRRYRSRTWSTSTEKLHCHRSVPPIIVHPATCLRKTNPGPVKVDRIIVIQRMRGVTAHEMLEQIVEETGMQELLVRYAAYPEAVLWRLVRQLLEQLMEPARRRKLPQHNSLDDAVNLIRNANRIIVLTGAGISVSCGIPDFRSENGIYQRQPSTCASCSRRAESLTHTCRGYHGGRLGEYHLPNPQCMFDLEFFNGNPKPFFHFAKELLPGNFVPAPTHFFIGELHSRGKLRRNFTQNIDGLERLAGASGEVPWGGDVLHQCHGHFETITCTNPECRHKGVLANIRPQIEAQQATLPSLGHVIDATSSDAP